MPQSGPRDDSGEVFVGDADVEELIEWWQDQEEGWDSDAVLDEWDSVRTGDGFTEGARDGVLPRKCGRSASGPGRAIISMGSPRSATGPARGCTPGTGAHGQRLQAVCSMVS